MTFLATSLIRNLGHSVNSMSFLFIPDLSRSVKPVIHNYFIEIHLHVSVCPRQSSFELLLHPAASQFYFEWQHERVLQALMCQGHQSVALQYFHVTKPPVTSTSQAKLCLSVLLHNRWVPRLRRLCTNGRYILLWLNELDSPRCLTEAWSLLRQHSNHLDIVELLGFLYESCQELNLIKELLKLPLRLHEQVNCWTSDCLLLMSFQLCVAWCSNLWLLLGFRTV